VYDEAPRRSAFTAALCGDSCKRRVSARSGVYVRNIALLRRVAIAKPELYSRRNRIHPEIDRLSWTFLLVVDQIDIGQRINGHRQCYTIVATAVRIQRDKVLARVFKKY